MAALFTLLRCTDGFIIIYHIAREQSNQKSRRKVEISWNVLRAEHMKGGGISTSSSASDVGIPQSCA